MYDNAAFKPTKFSVANAWIILILSCAVIFNQTLIANVSYHKLQLAYEKSYGVLIRIADRIEQTDNAEDASKIIVLGSLKGSEAYQTNVAPYITGTTDGYILRADDETVNQSVLCSALNDYCGKNLSFVHGKERKDFLEKNNTDNMECWPKSGCISVIDDTIVIKFSRESGK